MIILKCSNEECGHTFSNDVERCPFCGTPISDKNEMIETENDNENLWVMLWKFLHRYEEMTPSKAYLLLGGEFVLGIGFVLLGWAMSSNSGYRGNSTGAFGFLIGGVILFYSLYAIIKHTTRLIILKKEPNAKETKIRGIAFLAELIMGGFIFLIGNSISGDRDTADMIRIMAIGMIAVAVLSILKFLIKQSSVKK